ncbi:MAG: hypothetical protein AB1797_05595 [bacterium]
MAVALICLLFTPVPIRAQDHKYEDVSEETQEAIKNLKPLLEKFIAKFPGPRFQPYQGVTRQDLLLAFYEYDQFRRWLENQNRFFSEKMTTLEETVSSLNRQLKGATPTAGKEKKETNIDELIKEVEYLLPQLITNAPTMPKIAQREIEWLKLRLDSLERKPAAVAGSGASEADISRMEGNLRNLASRLDDLERSGVGEATVDTARTMREVEKRLPSLIKDEMKKEMKDMEGRISTLERQGISGGGEVDLARWEGTLRGLSSRIETLEREGSGGKVDTDKVTKRVEEKLSGMVKDEIKEEMKDIDRRLFTLEKSPAPVGKTYSGSEDLGALEASLDLIQRELRDLRKTALTEDDVKQMMAKETPRGRGRETESEDFSALKRQLKRSEIVTYLSLVVAFAAILIAQ